MPDYTKIEFDHPINVSLQVGDTVLFANNWSGQTINTPHNNGYDVTEIGSHYIIIHQA